MQITIDLTDEQVKYLKQFAANQYENAKDNLGTEKPIHLVQTQEISTVFDGGGNGDIDDIFVVDYYSDYSTFENERDIVLKFSDNEYENEDDVPEYEETDCYDLEDYLQTYGVPQDVIDTVSVCSRKVSYKTVAYFFILENARKYIKQMAHKLNNPRTYTDYRGYGNEAEFEPFFDLLMSMGTQLNDGNKPSDNDE